MGVEACGHRWIGLPGDEPRRPMVGVTIAFVIDGYDVHQDGIFGTWVVATETDPHRREHSSNETHNRRTSSSDHYSKNNRKDERGGRRGSRKLSRNE